MKLKGITLETVYFEEYLSFLTEVLELEVIELSEISMRLDLQSTWLEIKKTAEIPHQLGNHIEFELAGDEFIDLVGKVNFFYYRKGPSRFLFLGADDSSCRVVDPDGRTWRFFNSSRPFSAISHDHEAVRIF